VRAIERHVLDRGWAIAIILAAIASAIANHLEPPLFAVFLLSSVCDVSLMLAGVILVALGIRRVRRVGPAPRHLVYPIGGMLLFAALIAASVVGHRILEDAIRTLEPNVPPYLVSMSDSLGSVPAVWLAVAFTSILAGILTPIRSSPAA